MDKTLVSASPDVLRQLGITVVEPDRTKQLQTISKAVYGDLDISKYQDFDPLMAGFGEDQANSIMRPRFVALLRRRTDGALRLVRHWASNDHLENEMMVADGDRWMIEEAFSTHDITTRINASSICHAYESVEATDEDIRCHDAAVLRELAWHARRAAGRMMTPSLAETLKDVAHDMVRETRLPLGEASNIRWEEGFGGSSWYVGQEPTVSRFQATNNHHLRAIVARLQDAGDTEAAGTITWLCWHRDIDFNRSRFLVAEATRIQQERVSQLEAALTSIAALDQETHHYVDSTMRQNPVQCYSVYAVGRIVEDSLEQSRSQGASYDAFLGRK